MVWKLIKALVRRIKAWGDIKTHVRLLLTRVDNEIDKIKEKQKCGEHSERNDFLIWQLEQRRTDLCNILEHMREIENANKRERVVVEDELL